MGQKYPVEQIIRLLENRQFDDFRFADGCAYIASDRTAEGEICIEAPGGIIPAEKIPYITNMLRHLDDCIQKAHERLGHFSLKKDQWFPHALDQGFLLYGISFGTYTFGHDPKPVTDGFALTFQTADPDYPCKFTVRFLGSNLRPVAAEEWIS